MVGGEETGGEKRNPVSPGPSLPNTPLQVGSVNVGRVVQAEETQETGIQSYSLNAHPFFFPLEGEGT